MNDLELLSNLRHPVGADADAAVAAGRVRLLEAIAAPRAKRPRIRWIAVASAAAAAAVVAVIGLHPAARRMPRSTALPARMSLAEQVLRAAALSAASQPAVRPRPGQWIYTETVEFEPGSRTSTAQNWMTFDGRNEAYRVGGRLEVHRAPVPVHVGPLRVRRTGASLDRYMHAITPMSAYDALASLPARSGPMLASIRRAAAADPGAVIPPGGSPSPHTTTRQLEFEFLANLLWNAAQAAPGLAEAAAFRALAAIPGVTVQRHAIDAAGRPAIALSDAGVQSQLLLDRRTYQVTGLRMISNGHWPVNPKSSRTIPAGVVVDSLAWVRIVFVARPGER